MFKSEPFCSLVQYIMTIETEIKLNVKTIFLLCSRCLHHSSPRRGVKEFRLEIRREIGVRKIRFYNSSSCTARCPNHSNSSNRARKTATCSLARCTHPSLSGSRSWPRRTKEATLGRPKMAMLARTWPRNVAGPERTSRMLATAWLCSSYHMFYCVSAITYCHMLYTINLFPFGSSAPSYFKVHECRINYYSTFADLGS